MFENELDADPPFTFETRALLLCDHGPTHVDAPLHHWPDSTPISKLSLADFYTPEKAINVFAPSPR